MLPLQMNTKPSKMSEVNKKPTSVTLKFITNLQVIGIILVVLGHSFYMANSVHGTNLLVMRLIYSFHMPLFIFVSGFLLQYSEFGGKGDRDLSIGRFAKKKAQRLLVPYIVLTLVTFVPRAALSGIADDSIEMSWSAFFRSFLFFKSLVIPYFWYVQACFVLLVVCFSALVLTRGRIGHGVVLAVLMGVFLAFWFVPFPEMRFFSINKVLEMAPYFVCGMAYAKWQTRCDEMLHIGSLACTVIAGALWLAAFCSFGPYLSGLISLPAIVMCVSLAHNLENSGITVLDHLAGANYLIFLLSWYFNVLSQQVLSHFVTLPWWVHTVLSLFSGLYAPWLIYRWMQTHKGLKVVKMLARLLGQKV